ncbi:TPA: tRNA-dihydrouridine synthase [Candidatus Saccharibacteria bacterium]|nr:tRNA-dihydrouridine synthase [Candidatus Saccharibacteria bacterium]HIO87907.1 tRNA-dihydrouridine synthase [Candidatus Saccharibacteria bacterium]
MTVWDSFNSPFFALAPMDDVTDVVFRSIVADCAAPDVFFTEFANADGLQTNGRPAVLQKLAIGHDEGVIRGKKYPIIAQIWGLKPENYYKTTQELIDLGYDGVDINMGCPVPVVTKKGACSALINNQPLAHELIAATKEAAAGKIAVSVKTRIGFKHIQTEEWLSFLLRQGIDALTVHGRTSKEMSKVPVHWEELAKVPTLRSDIAPATKVIANGDILSRADGEQLARDYNFDGIMIGRGIFQDLQVFSATAATLSFGDKIELFKKHIQEFEDTWGSNKNPAGLKKFVKTYLREQEGVSVLRSEIMQAQNCSEMLEVIDSFTTAS